jgi:hypothetical protein
MSTLAPLTSIVPDMAPGVGLRACQRPEPSIAAPAMAPVIAPTMIEHHDSANDGHQRVAQRFFLGRLHQLGQADIQQVKAVETGQRSDQSRAAGRSATRRTPNRPCQL